METIKAIAMLCSIMAGDNPSFQNMANIIENKQIECHAYYASCHKGRLAEVRSLLSCMTKRQNDVITKRQKALEKLKKK